MIQQQTSARIMTYLQGVQFPAEKGELVAHASQRGAGEDILLLLHDLPDKSYGSVVEVSEQIESAAEQI